MGDYTRIRVSRPMVDDKTLDLRTNKVGGCTGDPLIRLMSVLNEGLNEFHVIVQKSVIPVEVLKILLRRKGYEVEILEAVDEDTVLGKIYKVAH